MNIRLAAKSDFKSISKLHAASWKDAYRGMLSDEYLSGPVDDDLEQRWDGLELGERDFVLVAEEERVLQGFLMMWVKDEGYLDNLHVHPDVRSSGIGLQLLRRSVQHLNSLGVRSFYLWVLEQNAAAKRFYERHGGQIVGQEVKPVFEEQLLHLKMQWSGRSFLQLL